MGQDQGMGQKGEQGGTLDRALREDCFGKKALKKRSTRNEETVMSH